MTNLRIFPMGKNTSPAAYLSLCLLLIAACSATAPTTSINGTAQPAGTPAQIQIPGTFYEIIEHVQPVDISIGPKNSDASLSIPFTRIDVAIENGVAYTRIVQIYHNHSDQNQGYMFRLPIAAQTAITQFNLWDRGTRYLGTIEDREAAEAAYKKVTGDEAPTMNRDPGLVRRTENEFEMRVFPIFPDENKQIELIMQQPVDMINGIYTLELPVLALTHSEDERHQKVACSNTQVSVFVRDTLPVTNLIVNGFDARPEGVPDAAKNSYLFRHTFTGKASDVAVAYGVKAPKGVSTTPMLFDDGKNRYFAMRVLARHKDVHSTPATEKRNKPFYIGLWRSKGGDKKQPLNVMPMGKEVLGFLTLSMLDTRSGYQGSWIPPKMILGGGSQTPDITVFSEQLLYNVNLSELLGGLRQPKEAAKKTTNKVNSDAGIDVVAHLSTAIENDHIDLVYLFVDQISASMEQNLEQLMGKRTNVRFILISDDKNPHAAYTRYANVSQFSLQKGWIQNPLDTKDGRIPFWSSFSILGTMQLLAMSDVPLPIILKLWHALPNPAPTAPIAYGKGGARVDHLQLQGIEQFIAGPHPEDREKEEDAQVPDKKILRTFWVTGQNPIPGNLQLSFNLAFVEDVFSKLQGRTSPFAKETVPSIQLNALFPQQAISGRSIGTMWAQSAARLLDLRVQLLQWSTMERRRGGGISSDAKAKLDLLKKELVALSKEFSFITPETAFIAMPKEMLKEYGFQPQKVGAKEMYNLKAAGSSGVPEPHEWAMLILGLLALLALGKRYGWKLNKKQV